MSVRQAAREFGLSRKTIRKMLLFSLPPGYERKKPVLLGIPTMSISYSNLMSIRSERSDAGLSQCETVIGIRQEFLGFSSRESDGTALLLGAFGFWR